MAYVETTFVPNRVSEIEAIVKVVVVVLEYVHDRVSIFTLFNVRGIVFGESSEEGNPVHSAFLSPKSVIQIVLSGLHRGRRHSRIEALVHLPLGSGQKMTEG